MKGKRKTIEMVTLVLICCVIMIIFDGIIRPAYAIKSAVKIGVFFLCPILYSLWDKSLDLKSIFKVSKKGMKTTILLAVGVYVVIMGAYFLLRNVFDFSKITGLLESNAGVTGDKFIWVSIYISFVNSLLEEFFFRGFAFLTLKKLTTRKFAYIFSSVAFAFYHVAMLQGWFSPVLFILAMVGLAVGGAIFNYLNEKNGTLYNSWLVHMFANFAINTIGFILFGVI